MMRTYAPVGAVAAVIAVALASCNQAPKPTQSSVGSSPATVASQPPRAQAEASSATQSPPTVAAPAPTRVAAQHILVAYRGAVAAPRTVTRSKDQARQRAQQAANRAKQGEDFSSLVTEYSDDPTAKSQGNLGLFTRESKDKAFADAAFALPVDGVSDLVETKYGFHIIKRNQ